MAATVAEMNHGSQKIESPVTAPIPGTPTSAERHLTPEQLGELWGLSRDTIRRLFEREPGVLVIERSNGNGRRRYRTLRIPESVAARVHRRLTNPFQIPSR